MRIDSLLTRLSKAKEDSGKVNISGSTYELVKDLPAGQAGKFKCTHRGKIEANN